MIKTFKLPLVMPALLALPMALMAHEHDSEHHKTYLDEGEIDIALVYHADEGELEFTLFTEHDHDEDEHADEHEHGDEHEHEHGEGIHMDEAVILAGADTAFTLPQTGDFDFLGQAGTTVYILPQDPTAGPPAPGFAMEFEDGIVTGDIASVSLMALEGPGDLVAYILDGFGSVTIVFDTRNGLDAADTYTGSAESHQHLNWAFTEPGIYHLELDGSAQLASDETQLTTSGELMVQVGAGNAYLRQVEDYEAGWALSENLGEVYTPDFPWLYLPLLDGWTYADGPGGEEMYLFVPALNGWAYTGDELAPWFYDFANTSWLYILRQPDGSVYVYDETDSSWSPLP